MLKIKDSVDLKELEKFGFKKQKHIDETYFPNGRIKVEIENCYELKLGYALYCVVESRENWKFPRVPLRAIDILPIEYGENHHFEAKDLDVIFDLIKNNIIEKISEI